jgi:HEAT repeat protein
MDVLLLAAETNREPAEQLVRRGAVQAIAMRAFNLRQADGSRYLGDAKFEETLLRLAADDDPLIRSETAYALGRIGTPASLKLLETLVDDPHADTRYNAAVALAHDGNAKSINMLAEMLEPAPLASVLEEPDAQSRVRKRATIAHNAMEAAQELSKKNPTADVSPIIKALDELAAADDATLETALIPRGATSDAKRVLEVMRKPG